jgi:type II secretory ATPase GspE/PulE/Tfp pilus assembly ATPase PilB-like protein
MSGQRANRASVEFLICSGAVAPVGRMNPNLLTLGEGLFLVSFWKPLILLIPFVGWAWIISRIYDKHAERFHLARTKWNVLHLSFGFVAFFAALAIPIQGELAFWVGLLVAISILAVDLAAYAVVANRDERVPEEHRVRLDFSKLAEARQAKAAEKRAGKVELVIKGPDKQEIIAPERETPEFDIRVAAEAIILKGLEIRASQADIAPTGRENTYGVSYLVDGVRQPGDTLPAANAVKLMDFWKGSAKLDVADRRKRQSGDVNVEHGADRAKLRIITSGTTGGIRMTMLYDPEKQVRRKAADLGLLENQMKELQAIVDDRRGVVLLAAPIDGGRTTSLYSVVRMHDAYTTNIQTIEMEPQDSLEGVRQNEYTTTGEGAEYSTTLRTILRRDPQIVGVAEMPDEATAREVARADHERTRLYLSLRTDNAITAIQAYVKAVGDADLAAKSLHGVTAQKLMRKLCINCRVPYQPSPDMLKKLNLPADKVKQLFKKGGQVLIKNKPEICPVCRGIGYIGQEGAFEVYRIDKAERDMIRSGNWNALRAEFRKRGLPTVQQAALAKVLAGITSVEEFGRITSEGARPSGSAPGAAKPGAGKPPAGPAPTPAKPGNKPEVGSAR